MNKIYNENDLKQSKLIKDLKELPKIEAPENFEYNLMTRIQNKNFGESLNEKPMFNFVKFFAPSAIVVTIVLLFFIFLPTADQRNVPSNSTNSIENQAIADNSVAPFKKEENAKNSVQQTSPNAGTIAQPSMSSNQRPINQIDDSRSVKVDDYISGANSNKTDLERGNVVSGGNQPVGDNGFFISERPDKKTLDRYRARVDSVKKAQLKADSLKKAQKTH
jgi:hypothetical protein